MTRSRAFRWSRAARVDALAPSPRRAGGSVGRPVGVHALAMTMGTPSEAARRRRPVPIAVGEATLLAVAGIVVAEIRGTHEVESGRIGERLREDLGILGRHQVPRSVPGHDPLIDEPPPVVRPSELDVGRRVATDRTGRIQHELACLRHGSIIAPIPTGRERRSGGRRQCRGMPGLAGAETTNTLRIRPDLHQPPELICADGWPVSPDVDRAAGRAWRSITVLLTAQCGR